MNVKEIYKCTVCHGDYENAKDANFCCEPPLVYQCSCLRQYRHYKDANDCCHEKPEEEKEPFDFISFGDEHD